MTVVREGLIGLGAASAFMALGGGALANDAMAGRDSPGAFLGATFGMLIGIPAIAIGSSGLSGGKQGAFVLGGLATLMAAGALGSAAVLGVKALRD